MSNVSNQRVKPRVDRELTIKYNFRGRSRQFVIKESQLREAFGQALERHGFLTTKS